jgi:hypothetical protein
MLRAIKIITPCLILASCLSLSRSADARPRGSWSSKSRGSSFSRQPHRWRPWGPVYIHDRLIFEPVFYPHYYFYPRVYAVSEPSSPSLLVSAGTEVGGRLDAFTASFHLALEGERLGTNLQAAMIYTRAEGGSFVDATKLFRAHITWALLSTEDLRLRIEGGVGSMFTPEGFAVGPSVGASFAVGIAGPVGLEASIQNTPWPFVQVDGQAGVVVSLGPVLLRGGWREIMLDDRGIIDGTLRKDLFGGPYLGLAFVL